MKVRGSSSFRGSEIALLFLIVTFASVFLAVLAPGPVISVVVQLLYAMLYLPFVIFLFARAIVSGLRFGDYEFRFTGRMGDFFVLNIKGVLLSIVTLGIYVPWYLKAWMSFFASSVLVKSSASGSSCALRFDGKVKTFWKYWLFGFLLPYTVLLAMMIYCGFFIAETVVPAYPNAVDHVQTVVLILLYSFALGFCFVLVAYVLLAPFYCLLFKWCAMFSLSGADGHTRMRVRADFSLFRASCFFAAQCFLAVVSLGLLSALATVNLYKYFVSRIQFYPEDAQGIAGQEKIVREDAGKPLGGFSVEMSTAKGFLFLFVQGLLIGLTLGIYLPWGYAQIVAFLARHTWLEFDATKMRGNGGPLLLTSGAAGETGASCEPSAPPDSPNA